MSNSNYHAHQNKIHSLLVLIAAIAVDAYATSYSCFCIWSKHLNHPIRIEFGPVQRA